MHTPNDLSQSRIVLKQDSILVAVVEMSLSSYQNERAASIRMRLRRDCAEAGVVAKLVVFALLIRARHNGKPRRPIRIVIECLHQGVVFIRHHIHRSKMIWMDIRVFALPVATPLASC